MNSIVTCVTCEQVLTGGRCTNGRCPGYMPSEEEDDTAQKRIAELEGENARLRPVVEWAARGPCLCHPANKARGMDCLKDAADIALAPKSDA